MVVFCLVFLISSLFGIWITSQGQRSQFEKGRGYLHSLLHLLGELGPYMVFSNHLILMIFVFTGIFLLTAFASVELILTDQSKYVKVHENQFLHQWYLYHCQSWQLQSPLTLTKPFPFASFSRLFPRFDDSSRL